MQNKFTAKIISLQEAYSASHRLALNIMKSSESFDIVIAVARGGMFPARLMCDFLNIGRLASMQIKHYESGAEILKNTEIIDPVTIDISGRKVLIVDDVNDTGETLIEAVNHVQSLKPALLKTAVLHEKKNTVFEADFSIERLDEWKWLVYEWAATEDILSFLKNDGMLQQNIETVRDHLAKKYDLFIEHRLLHDILQMEQNYF